MCGSLVGVLFSESTRLRLMLPYERESGLNVSFPKTAVLPTV